MEPFVISIQEEEIKDLKERIANTRWPFHVPDSGWKYGTDLNYLKELFAYWLNKFDWRLQEARLNQFKQFFATVDNFKLHFIYEKGQGSINLPLLLIHGYPDSFYRFIKLIPLLTKPDENGIAFDVIVPSIPGFGFSEHPLETGIDRQKIADLFTKLMTEQLGYKKFFIQGGDWGGSIAQQMGLRSASFISAIHLSSVPSPLITHAKEDELSEEEKSYYFINKKWQSTEGTFALLQSTKPQTLAYALNDSPAGLAAWFIDKFKSWSDNNGNIEERFSKNDLIVNLCIYWFTQTSGSSERLYYEAEQQPPVRLGEKVEVPTFFAIFPKDILLMPLSFAKKYFNVQQWTNMSAGGHFAALEVPEALSENIRKAFEIFLNKG